MHALQLLSARSRAAALRCRHGRAAAASRLPLAARPDLGDGGNMRPVVDLLVEQIECADFVLLNKTDLLPGGLEGEALEQLQDIVASLNPLATVIACEQAKVRRAAGHW